MAKLTEEELLFRKVEEKVKKAIFEYGLIEDGDRILVGLSGGKDSLALVDLLGRRSKIFRPRFEVVVTHIVMSNIPYRSDIDYLRSRADEHGRIYRPADKKETGSASVRSQARPGK